MGSDFLIETFPPVDILVEGSAPELCRNWVREVLDENAGGPLNISCHLEPGYHLPCLEALNETYRLEKRKPDKLA